MRGGGGDGRTRVDEVHAHADTHDSSTTAGVLVKLAGARGECREGGNDNGADINAPRGMATASSAETDTEPGSDEGSPGSCSDETPRGIASAAATVEVEEDDDDDEDAEKPVTPTATDEEEEESSIVEDDVLDSGHTQTAVAAGAAAAAVAAAATSQSTEGDDDDDDDDDAAGDMSSAEVKTDTTTTTTTTRAPSAGRTTSSEGGSVVSGIDGPGHEADVSVPAQGVLESAPQYPPPDVLLCLDIEATCAGHRDAQGRRVFEQGFEYEVLELPVEAVDAHTGQHLSRTRHGWRFHTYVRPEKPPTEFCTDLTGIDDAVLAEAPDLAEALRRLEVWLERRALVPWPMADTTRGEMNFIWITDGNWDFGKFLWHNCRRTGVPYPPACIGWCDVRESFAATWPEVALKPPILQNMVKGAGLTWSGRPHRGHVDTKNLASLVSVLVACSPTSLLPTRCLPRALIYAPGVPLSSGPGSSRHAMASQYQHAAKHQGSHHYPRHHHHRAYAADPSGFANPGGYYSSDGRPHHLPHHGGGGRYLVRGGRRGAHNAAAYHPPHHQDAYDAAGAGGSASMYVGARYPPGRGGGYARGWGDAAIYAHPAEAHGGRYSAVFAHHGPAAAAAAAYYNMAYDSRARVHGATAYEYEMMHACGCAAGASAGRRCGRGYRAAQAHAQAYAMFASGAHAHAQRMGNGGYNPPRAAAAAAGRGGRGGRTPNEGNTTCDDAAARPGSPASATAAPVN